MTARTVSGLVLIAGGVVVIMHGMGQADPMQAAIGGFFMVLGLFVIVSGIGRS